MPLPMVHLAVAVTIEELRGQPLSPAFLLGSIAPDAIHMRPGAEQADKLRVHFLDQPGVLDRERLGGLLTRHRSGAPDCAGFVEGYAAHVIADAVWYRRVVEPFFRRVTPDLSQEELRRVYYQDTDQIDFDLYRGVPWRARVWKLLAASCPCDCEGLLTVGEIERWRDRTLDWFDTLKKEPMIRPVYITAMDVAGFVPPAAREIVEQFAAWSV